LRNTRPKEAIEEEADKNAPDEGRTPDDGNGVSEPTDDMPLSVRSAEM